MTEIIIKLFFIAFFINLLYEILHSFLYETCLNVHLKRYIFLIFKAAIFDGFSITAIYFIVSLIFANNLRISMFLLISLIFAYGYEKYALSHKRWKYSNSMPILLGVGITPLIQLALTGLLSIYLVLNFC